MIDVIRRQDNLFTYNDMNSAISAVGLVLQIMVACVLFHLSESSQKIRETEKTILDSILNTTTYDNRIRPAGKLINESAFADGPCIVKINVMVRSIGKISDLDMEYSVQITFRQEWTDSRLAFPNKEEFKDIISITVPDPDKVWKPDVFFRNEKEGHFHQIILPNVLLRIDKYGAVLYSIRLSLVLACPMDLKFYPLDTQTCNIEMASYGYTTTDLKFIWKAVKEPVQVPKDLHLPTFSLKKDYNMTDDCASNTSTGEYSCIKVVLKFQREFSYYLIQIYIPCIMLVIVSWVSFWLDPNAIPARVSLGVTTLLTMATQISGINASLPPVSYIKAIDVWTGVCLFFVFGALLEFALVNYASRSDAHRAALKKHEDHQQKQVQQVLGGPPKWEPQWDSVWERKWESRLDTKGIGFPFHNDASTRASYVMKPILRPQNTPQPPLQPPLVSNKFRQVEVRATPNRHNFLMRWIMNFKTRSKRIDVIARIIFPIMFAMFNVVYWVCYIWFLPEKSDTKH